VHNSDVIAKKLWHIEMSFWEDNCKLKRAKFKTSVSQKSSLPPHLLVAISVCILGGKGIMVIFSRKPNSSKFYLQSSKHK
jgi:hypothetical protein